MARSAAGVVVAAPPAIGVDVGGTKIAAGVVTADGAVIHRLRRSVASTSPNAVAVVIADLVTQLRQPYPDVPVGVALAGWFNLSRSMINFSPHLGWASEPFRERLADLLGGSVIMYNDADAAAWAEYRFGAGRQAQALLCVTLGTGIGGGLVLGGQLYRGSQGMAGEWGHIALDVGARASDRCACGGSQCWELFASGNALGAAARQLASTRPAAAAELLRVAQKSAAELSGEDVTKAAAAGEATAGELIAATGRHLGVGLGALAAIWDPDQIVVGGGLSLAGEMLLTPARAAFVAALPGSQYRQPPVITAAALGNESGLIGVADLARRAATAEPHHRQDPGARRD